MICMHKWKILFSVATILFAFAGLIHLLPNEISSPLMFVFMGLKLLVDAKEYYDKGDKKNAVLFVGVVVFIYVVTIYNLLSRIF